MKRHKGKSGILRWNIVLGVILGFAGRTYADPQGATQGVADGPGLDASRPPKVIEQPSVASHPDFTGFWVLDSTASDDPKKLLKAARTDDGEEFGRRSGESGTAGDAGFSSGPMAGFFMDQFEIVHQDPLLTITSRQYGTCRIYTDYRGSTVSAMGDLEQPITTGGWEGAVLVIEITTAGGNHATQRLQLLTEPRRLERVTEFQKLDRQGKPIKVRQIFLLKDRQTAGTATPGDEAK